jgi:peptidyl-prolyl cis-trans isomerase C
MLEDQIERQLAQFAAYLPPEQRKQQKEAMVKRFASAQARLQMLNQFVAREVLYRQAREAKLAEEPTTRALLTEAEKMILAQRAMERELADQIKITPTDLQTYYEAHKKDYVQPERAQISHILLKDQKAADAALRSLKEGAKFDDLAKRLSQDEATKAKGGEVEGWVDRGSYIPGIGMSDEATATIFSTEAGKVADKPVKTDKGFHIILVRQREAERQKSLDEVGQQVYRALRSAKEREVQQNLLERLKEKYDVVIHHARFEEKKPEAPEPDTATPPAKKDEKKAK